MTDTRIKIIAFLGYNVDVVQTDDGKYIVEWFNFNTPPPPKGSTEEEALEEFYNFLLKSKGDTDGIDNTGDAEPTDEAQGS